MPTPTDAPDKTQPATSPSKAATKPITETEPQVELPPAYRVVLHNDEVNFFHDVVRNVYRLTPLSLPEAYDRTVEAHRSGRSTLLSTHRERAELYVEQFASVGLTVTIEPDG